MVVSLPHSRNTRRRGRRFAFRLNLEALETRTLPSLTWPGFLNPVAEKEPNDTLDQAQNLGDLSTAPRAEVVGTISNNAGGGGVDWYSFQLDRAADVTISTPKAQPSSPPVTTLSLYNSDPNDWNDPYDPLGYRLLDQADSATQGGAAQIEQKLAAGSYYVAVSGSGNHYFNPFLADSGYAGATGDYGLLLTAADLKLPSSDGPLVLTADPQPGANLDRSPFLIRVDLSEPLDPTTVSAGGTVQLLSNANGTFGDGTDQPVNLASVNLNTAGNELLIAPTAPLPPSFYKVVLAGDSRVNAQFLADLNAIPLGTDSSHPAGADFSYTFQISGNEGLLVSGANSGGRADDTPATSHQLGDITKAGLVQLSGAIGDDATDLIPFDGSDVDLYHFRVSGIGRYALTAEVFAGRIGSPLNTGLSLFQMNSTTGKLSLIGSNSGSLNTTVASNGTRPLSGDPVLFTGLEPGDYYLAVSNSLNVPDPVNSPPGTNGVFDPNVSHSGQNGGSTGAYVLNMQVQPTTQNAPQVLAVNPTGGAILGAPPTQLTVQFSEPVNLPQLALQEPMQGVPDTCAAVYVQGSNGAKYYPRLESYDASTNQATFLMLDSLSTDTYQLHLSGPLGLAGFGGNLAGNDASGDYVVSFKVNAPARGTGTNPLLWLDQEPNNDLGQAQNIGTLFHNDLLKGVTLQRDFTQNPATAPADTADYYRFQILESGWYFFNFGSSSLPAGTNAILIDASGASVTVMRQPRTLGFSTNLKAGSYVLHIGDWKPSQAAGVKYTVTITLGTTTDNPVPLTVGPAPAISLQVASDTPPSPPPQPPVVSLPPSPPPVVTSTAAAPVVNATPVSSTGTSQTAADAGGASPVAEAPTAVLAAATAPASPPLPSASVALLVNLLVPTGVSNAALPPAPPRASPNRPAESITLPAAVLLALGTAPVGAVKDPVPTDAPAPAERVLVRLPDLSGARPLQAGTAALLRTESGSSKMDPPLVSPWSRVETTEEGPPRSFELVQGSPSRPGNAAREMTLTLVVSAGIGELVKSWYQGALDAFFSLARWVEATPAEPPQSVSLPPALASEAEPQAAEQQDSTRPLGTASAPNVAHSILAIGLAALTAVAMARPESKRAQRTLDRSI